MKILKWGLIGAGDIAQKRIAPALRDLPNCELAAVSRLRFELAESFAGEFGARKFYADWREMLENREVEAVYIATPVFLHKEQTIAAANAGKHVLCEKPMALNSVECDEMIAACEANNVKLGIAYYRRFYPVIVRIKEVIASGEIGKVVAAQINAFEFFDPPPEHPRRWLLQKKKSGGGPLKDFGCHRLEVLTNLFGQVSNVKSIVGSKFFQREVEDTATIILQFANGTQATLTVSHAAFENQDTLDIFGTKGSLHVPVLNKGDFQIKTVGGERTELCPNPENVHQPLIEDFTNAILENIKPNADAEVGRAVEILLERIYQNN